MRFLNTTLPRFSYIVIIVQYNMHFCSPQYCVLQITSTFQFTYTNNIDTYRLHTAMAQWELNLNSNFPSNWVKWVWLLRCLKIDFKRRKWLCLTESNVFYDHMFYWWKRHFSLLWKCLWKLIRQSMRIELSEFSIYLFLRISNWEWSQHICWGF